MQAYSGKCKEMHMGRSLWRVEVGASKRLLVAAAVLHT